MAVEQGKPRVVRRLIRAGADVNAHNSHQETPLIVLLKRPWLSDRHERILKTLLQAGADVHWADAKGYTPLFYAAIFGHPRAVRLLLRTGADPSLIGSGSQSPVGYAMEAKFFLEDELRAFHAYVKERKIEEHPLVRALMDLKRDLVKRYQDCEVQLYGRRILRMKDESEEARRRIEEMERQMEAEAREYDRIMRAVERDRRRRRRQTDGGGTI